MRLTRHAFRILFAIALMAQLAAPVLAANAKAINLFCPAHASRQQDENVHSAHAAHAMQQVSPRQQHTHAASAVIPDEPVQERKLFDLSCCSVHLTGVMPAPSASFHLISVRLHGIPAADPAAVSPGMADPPPRIFV